jgi:hypothetical protein
MNETNRPPGICGESQPERPDLPLPKRNRQARLVPPPDACGSGHEPGLAVHLCHHTACQRADSAAASQIVGVGACQHCAERGVLGFVGRSQRELHRGCRESSAPSASRWANRRSTWAFLSDALSWRCCTWSLQLLFTACQCSEASSRVSASFWDTFRTAGS